MANYIEAATAKANRFVIPSSRYIDSQVYYYSDERIITFETYKRKPIEDNPSDQYTVIPASREYRPDLMAFAAYGDVGFWWKIMEANNMKDVLEFKTGVNIRIPGNIFL